MNSLIVLIAVVSCAVASYAPYAPHAAYASYGYIPTVTHDGFLLDTPEVAHAKANHFALYNQAAYAAAAAPDVDVHYDGYAPAAYAPAAYAPAAYAPAAYAPAAYAPAAYASAAYHAAPAHGYHGYIPTVTADGFLADTPEVAHAKANFFHLYNQAAAAAAPAYNAAPDVYNAPAVTAHVAATHHTYPAATHYTHLGPHYAAAAYGGHYAHGAYAAGAYVPADTPAVAAAKAEHFAAHAKAIAAAH